MESVVMRGAVVIGGGAVDSCSPTASIANLPFELVQPSGSRQTGAASVSSAVAFVALPVVGPLSVKEADFFYLKCSSPLVLRLTYKDNSTATFAVDTLFFATFPSSNRVVLAEVMGVASAEFCASGNL